MPGLVQAHIHLCQTLFRGLSEERPLLAWLRERIWPLEAAHDATSLRASARLGIAELLLSGTTAVLDMGTVHHTEQLFLAAEESGIRYTGGQAMMDRGEGVPAGLRQPTAEAMAESDALFARWDGAAGGRLRYAYTPRFILSCSAALMEAVAERARAGRPGPHPRLRATGGAGGRAGRDRARRPRVLRRDRADRAVAGAGALRLADGARARRGRS